MKKINKKYLLSLLIIVSILLLFTGCSDMMEKLGNIYLSIELDVPNVSVSSYTLNGCLAGSSVTCTTSVPTSRKVDLSSLKPGKWTLTVTAYDAGNNQIGVGTQTVELKKGQVLDTTVLVVCSQAAPTSGTFTLSSPTRYDSADGKISGTTAKMEYKLATAGESAAYTACTEGDTILASGTYLVRYAACHGLEASQPLSVTVPTYQPIQLTIGNPTLTTSKVYDKTLTIAGSVVAGALVGIQGSDNVTVSAEATYDSATVGNSKTITVVYTLGGTDKGNYLKPVDKTVTGAIVKKELTVTGTAISASKVYDGTTTATVTNNGTLQGTVSGDTVTVTATATYTSATAGASKPLTIQYTLGGADASNYLAKDDASKTANITKATYDMSGISFNNGAVTYNGTAQSLAISGTLPSGVSVQYTQATNAGLYDITASFSGDTVNYEAIADKHANLTINKAQMTGSVSISGTSLYGESLTAVPNLVETGTPTYQWIRGDVAISGANAATYTITASDIGSPIKVTATLDGTNYQGSITSDATASVAKKTLAVVGTTIASTKVYDGTTTAAITATGSLQGVVSGDSVTVSGATAVYDSPDAGEDKNVTISYTLGGSDATKYQVNDTSKTANISKATMSGTIAISGTAIYGEVLTATPSLTNAGTPTYQWMRDDAVISGATSSTYTLAAADIGSTIKVTATAGGANYQGAITSAATASINKKELTVTGTSVNNSKVYDGTTTATVTDHGTLQGIVSGDVVTVTAAAAYASSDAGTDKPLTITYTLGGAAASNYSVNNDTSKTASITKATYDMSGISFRDGSTTYNGTAQTLAISGTLPSGVTVQYTSFTNAGTYDVTASFTADTLNHEPIADKHATLTIFRALMMGTVTISGTPTYGSVLTATTNLSNSGTPTYQWKRNEAAIIGATSKTYTLTAADIGKSIKVAVTAEVTNYNGTITSGATASVAKRMLTVSGTTIASTKVYDGTTTATITADGTLQGVVSGDTVTVSVTAAYNSSDAGTSKPVTITYTLGGANASSYSINTDTSKSADISKATMSGSIAISGNATNSGVLTAVLNLTNAGTPTYQWKRNDVAITGATGITYTLVTDDIGSTIKVTATAGGDNYQGSITSSATATVTKGSGSAIDDAIIGYFPSLPATQTILNFTSFTANKTGVEACVSMDGTTFGSYADLEVDSRGRAMIQLASGATTAAKVKFRQKETSTTYAGPEKTISISGQSLAVGDYYQGGIVAYFYTSYESGYVSGQVHGLIAAKSDVTTVTTGAVWSDDLNTIIGTQVAIGTGLANTNKIISALGSAAPGSAAGVARAYMGGAYTDWFLPSWNEMLRLHTNKTLIGNFITSSGSTYWTSSESTQTGYSPSQCTHGVLFDGSTADWVYFKYDAYFVRPVRYF